jgi:hypothetical protein
VFWDLVPNFLVSRSDCWIWCRILIGSVVEDCDHLFLIDGMFCRIDCQKKGGVRFTIGGNPYFLMVLIHNVGGVGDIQSVKIKGSYSGWVPMFRNWGAMWTVRSKIAGALSFLITLSDGSSGELQVRPNVGEPQQCLIRTLFPTGT